MRKLTSTCKDPIEPTGQRQLLFGLEGQQLVCADEGRGSKLGTGLVQHLRHDCLVRNMTKMSLRQEISTNENHMTSGEELLKPAELTTSIAKRELGQRE